MAACQKSPININPDSGVKKLVLAGNPNVGKSVFFNYLTGLYVDVANYPGTTLDIYTGRYQEWVVYDTPGIYGFSSFNQAEKLICDLILGADLVLNIVNAVTLDRDLFLTRQIIDTGVPVVVALNMGDEAARRGLRIDTAVLSRELGVPVVPAVAVEGKGLKETAAALVQGKPGHPDPAITEQLALWRRQKQFNGTLGAALAAMEDDEIQREKAYYSRRQQVNRV
ncbi:MAG: FeoB small GTPase domain-containing protein, partial [Heliobacteriaceae bacterium]|nr:FeoB small GTPase domain-containing protein [Heliobacteriaceae bacterium]